MQQALEGALERAEYVIASAQQRPPKRKYSSSGETSLYGKLYAIYAEECEKEPEVTEELRSNVNLLEKLVRRESLPCLVVNLYPGKEGYSLVLREGNGSSTESVRLPYEAGELLEYLDAEELPPVLVDVLEKSQVNVFHHGCVIAEIRDYRQCSDRERPGYQSRHILLRPTMQTLACDVEAIASDHQNWTQEDKLLLESQLILATAEPLCLDPSVSVACTANRLLYNKQKLNTLPMKRSFKRFSTASLNRQEELSHCPPPPELRALTSCKKIRESKTGADYGLKTFKAGNCVDLWKQRPCDLAVPSRVDVEKYAKGKKSVRYGDPQPRVWPVHEVQGGLAFGREAGYQPQATRLTIRQPIDNSLASGKGSGKEVTWETQLCPPHSSTDDHSNSFLPRPKTDAGNMVSRPEELVQKSARCPVLMSHSSGGSASLRRQPSPGKEPEEPETGRVQCSGRGRGAKHLPPPLRLPWSSAKVCRGDGFTSQQAGSSQACPSPGPAPKPPSLSQKSSVGLNRVSWLPAAALSPAASSQRPPDAQVTAISAGVKVPRVLAPGRGGQALGTGCAPRAPAPAGVQPGHLPAGARPPNPRPATPPPSSPPPRPPPPGGVQLLLKNTWGLGPFTVVQLPRGSVLWSIPQQAPQPRLSPLVPRWPCAPRSRGPGAPGSMVPGPGAPGSGVQGPGAQGSMVSGSGVQGPGAPGPGAPGSGVQGPGAKSSEAQGSGAPGLGAQCSGAQGPGTPGPGAKSSGAQGSGAQGSGVQGPGAHSSGPPCSGSQVAAGPRAAPRAEQAMVVHLRAVDGSLQARAHVLSPPGSGGSRPAWSLAQQGVPALASWQPQVHLTVVPCQPAAAPAAPIAPPPRGPQPGSQAPGTAERGPPAAPKP